MATLRDIADRAGVSVKTVSNVLNGKNQETWASTRERAARIRAIAAELGYRPDAAARATRLGRSRQVGLCYVGRESDGRINHLRLFAVIEGAQHAVEAAGYAATLVRLQHGGESKSLVERMFDGICCIGHVLDYEVAQVESLSPAAVMVDNNLWRPTGAVRRDERAAGRRATEALLAAGAERLLVLTQRTGRETNRHYSWTERLEGANQAVWAAGVPLRHEMLSIAAPWSDFPRLAEALAPGTGILCMNPTLALALQRWCAEHEPPLRLGRDLPVACADDHEDCARIWPGLARVAFDRYALGQAAGEMLLQHLATGEPAPSRELAGAWIAGDSCPEQRA